MIVVEEEGGGVACGAPEGDHQRMSDEQPTGGADEAADEGARARLARFGALEQGPDPSTWSTAQAVEHGPEREVDRFEELRRNLLLGGA